MKILKLISVIGLSLLSFSAFSADHQVKMLNNGADGVMVFEPAYLEAQPGDTVTFVSENPGHNSASVYVPDGAEAWDGEIGKDITVTLSAEGVYIYKCTPHLALAMVGVIKVGNPGDISGAQAAADSLAATIAVNKERVAKYMGMAQ